MNKKVDSAKPVKGDAIAPLKAIHYIVYGKAKHAAADSIFVATSAAERQELLDLGAARELDEVEAIVAKSLKLEAVAPEPEAPAPVAGEGEDFQ